MKVLLAYPGHGASTLDVARGYDKALRALGQDVRAFDYHTRLTFYNEALKRWEELNPNFCGHDNAILVMASEAVVLEAIDFVPDVVLVVCGLSLHVHGFRLLHRIGIPVVIILTESPYLDEYQANMIKRSGAEAAFTNDLYSLSALHEQTGVPIAYLPHSYDPEVHRPRPGINDYYQSDVFFFGTLWPERQRLFAPLLASQNGRDYKIGGIEARFERPEHDADIPDFLDNEEMARFYAGTKVALNHHRTIVEGLDGEERHIGLGEAYSVGPRAFEIAACGAFQLSDERPELVDLFGDAVPTYDDAEDLVEQVEYYLTHERERLERAEAAREAVQGCTFADRAEKIVIPFMEGVV